MDIVVAINKPEGWTSFDVVKKLSRTYKVKAGHSGTLDPMATGVLLVAFNKATKLLPYLMASHKTYEATMQLGISTDSKDITGNILKEKPVHAFTKKQVEEALRVCVGKQQQTVPKVSAIKVDGKRLYKHTDDIELPVREIEIFNLTLLDLSETTITYQAQVSKGTYIRVLSESIAKQLDMIATTSKLTRTHNSNVSLEQTQTLEEALQQVNALDTRQLLSDYRVIDIDDPTFIYHGKTTNIECEEDRVCFFYNNQPMAMYIRKEGTIFKSERGLF